MGKAILSI